MYILISGVLSTHCGLFFLSLFTVLINNVYIYIYIVKYLKGSYIVISKVKVKMATIVEGNPKAPFSIASTPMCRGGRYSFPGLLYFTLDPYLIMLSVKQGGIK